MRERVEGLVGRMVRVDVGDDVPLGLRAHPARRGRAARLHAAASRSTTRPTRCGWSSAASTSSSIDPKRFAPRAIKTQISRAKNELRGRRRLPRAGRLVLRADGRRRLRALREAHPRDERDGLRRPAVPHRQPARAVPRRARALPAAPSAGCWSTSTRTPTTPSTGCCSCSPASSATCASSATTTSRSTASAAPTSATSSTSSATSPARRSSSSSRTTARPRRSCRRPTRSSPTTRAASRSSCGPSSARASPCACASSTTSTTRRATSRRRSSGSPTEGVSRDEIAVFYRTNAQSRVLEDTLVRVGISYQVIGGTKFYERAEIKDALAYLTLLVNPQRHGLVRAHRQHAQARHRPDQPGPGAGPREHGRRCRCWRSRRCRRRCPASAPRRSRRSTASCPIMERLRELAERRRSATCSRRVLEETGYVEALEAERTIEAQGRLENLQELVGVAREFDANWDGEHGIAALAEFLQQLSLYSEQDALRDDERARDPDDPAQRQGPRVPGRLHHRLRGGRLPALALDRRGQPRGGAAPLLRRHHARAQQPLPDLRADALALRRALLQHPLALPRRDPGRADRRRAGSRDSPADGRRRRRPRARRRSPFRVGDDVDARELRRGRRDRRSSRAAS